MPVLTDCEFRLEDHGNEITSGNGILPMVHVFKIDNLTLSHNCSGVNLFKWFCNTIRAPIQALRKKPRSHEETWKLCVEWSGVIRLILSISSRAARLDVSGTHLILESGRNFTQTVRGLTGDALSELSSLRCAKPPHGIARQQFTSPIPLIGRLTKVDPFRTEHPGRLIRESDNLNVFGKNNISAEVIERESPMGDSKSTISTRFADSH
jgi:hypothetical protein